MTPCFFSCVLYAVISLPFMNQQNFAQPCKTSLMLLCHHSSHFLVRKSLQSRDLSTVFSTKDKMLVVLF